MAFVIPRLQIRSSLSSMLQEPRPEGKVREESVERGWRIET